MSYFVEVLSSDGVTPYTIEFGFSAEHLSVYCSCPAGGLGRLCKHKLELISGDGSRIQRQNRALAIQKISEMVATSQVPGLLARLRECEASLALATRELNASKKALERSLQQAK